MLNRYLAVVHVACLSIPLVNAGNHGIYIYAYSTSDCDYNHNNDNLNDIKLDKVALDGTCTSLLKKGSVAFDVDNTGEDTTLCQGALPSHATKVSGAD